MYHLIYTCEANLPVGYDVRCLVTIPVTVIFRDGKPFKAVCTDRTHRTIRRVNLDDICVDESLESRIDNSIRGESNKYFRACLRMLKDFQHSNGYELHQREYLDMHSILFATVRPSVTSCCVCTVMQLSCRCITLTAKRRT
jgi:hypothetical protein